MADIPSPYIILLNKDFFNTFFQTPRKAGQPLMKKSLDKTACRDYNIT
jgi:hypothetical protein